MVDDPELLDLVEMELRELLSSYELPGRRDPDCSRVRRWRLWRAGTRRLGRNSIYELMKAVDDYIPQPEPSEGQAVFDADRGRVLDFGPWHGGDGPG